MLVLKILNEFRKRQREKERMRIQTNQWERQCTWKACRPTENYVCVCVCVTKNTKANNLARERKSFMLSKYNFTLFDFDGTLDREREQVHAVNAIFFLLSLSSHLIASVLSALSATDCLCTVYTVHIYCDCTMMFSLPLVLRPYHVIPRLCLCFCVCVCVRYITQCVEERLHFKLAKLFNYQHKWNEHTFPEKSLSQSAAPSGVCVMCWDSKRTTSVNILALLLPTFFFAKRQTTTTLHESCLTVY